MATSSWSMASRTRRVAFRICVGLPALVLTLFGARLVVTGWFHAADRRVPLIAWGALEGVLLLAPLLMLLVRPAGQVGALRQALAVASALLATMVLTGAVDPFTLVLVTLIMAAAALYPNRSMLWRAGRFSPWRGALVVAAAVPLVAVGVHYAALQRTIVDLHARAEDYTGLAGWALALAATLAVTAFGAKWQLPAIVAAVAAAIVGVAMLLPGSSVRLGSAVGGLLLLTCALITLAAAALTPRQSAQPDYPDHAIGSAGQAVDAKAS